MYTWIHIYIYICIHVWKSCDSQKYQKQPQTPTPIIGAPPPRDARDAGDAWDAEDARDAVDGRDTGDTGDAGDAGDAGMGR